MDRMNDSRRRRDGAIALLATALLFASACDRLPPGGLFASGTVDETAFRARTLAYLQNATATSGVGGGE